MSSHSGNPLSSCLKLTFFLVCVETKFQFFEHFGKEKYVFFFEQNPKFEKIFDKKRKFCILEVAKRRKSKQNY